MKLQFFVSSSATASSKARLIVGPIKTDVGLSLMKSMPSGKDAELTCFCKGSEDAISSVPGRLSSVKKIMPRAELLQKICSLEHSSTSSCPAQLPNLVKVFSHVQELMWNFGTHRAFLFPSIPARTAGHSSIVQLPFVFCQFGFYYFFVFLFLLDWFFVFLFALFVIFFCVGSVINLMSQIAPGSAFFHVPLLHDRPVFLTIRLGFFYWNMTRSRCVFYALPK